MAHLYFKTEEVVWMLKIYDESFGRNNKKRKKKWSGPIHPDVARKRLNHPEQYPWIRLESADKIAVAITRPDLLVGLTLYKFCHGALCNGERLPLSEFPIYTEGVQEGAPRSRCHRCESFQSQGEAEKAGSSKSVVVVS
mgnify:CR=1 FL=1